MIRRPPISPLFPYPTLSPSPGVLDVLHDPADHDAAAVGDGIHVVIGDRKSTRLNSSHVRISYAVFCLKKKKYTARRVARKKTEYTGNILLPAGRLPAAAHHS